VKVSPFFVPQGETQQDGYAQLRYGWRHGLTLQAMVQVERWRAPLLASTPQDNVTTQLQLSYQPGDWARRRKVQAEP
jgi:hypothetical protein